MLAGVTRKVEIPHEDGEWLELKTLSWRELEQARKARSNEVFANMRAMGSDILATLRDVKTDDVQQAAADPVNEYDRATLLKSGIVGWSYESAFSPEKVDELDERTAAWAAAEIAPKPVTEEGTVERFFASTNILKGEDGR